MEISYTVTKADIRFLNKYAIKKIRNWIDILSSIVFGAIFYIFLEMIPSLPARSKPTTLAVLGMLLCILFAFLLSLSQYIKGKRKSNYYYGKLDLKIDKDGIYESSPIKNTFYSWECVLNIYNNKKYIILWLGGLVYVINKSSITGEDPQAFLNAATNFFEEYKKTALKT